MATGLERIPLAVDSDFRLQPVRANFPEQSQPEMKLIGFEPDQQAQPAVSSQKKDGGFVAAAKQAGGQIIKGAGRLAADIGIADDNNAVMRYGQEVIDANPTSVHSFSDFGDKPLTGVSEAVGNAGGSVAGMVGVRAAGAGITAAAPLAGPAAPIVAGIGQLVQWVGPFAIASLPSYSGIRDKQILDDPTTQSDGKAKAIAALGAGTVGLIENKFGPQQWAMAAFTKEGREALAKKMANWGLVGTTARSAAIEGAEELVQNPIEQAASFQNPTTKENLGDTAYSGFMGAIGGGALGGGAHVATKMIGAPAGSRGDNGSIPAEEVGAGPSGGVEGEFIPADRRALPDLGEPGNTYDQIRPTLPPGQPMFARPALPAPEDGGPSERQIATARGLLNHSPKASPDLLMRLMRVDATMAGMLFNHWQANAQKIVPISSDTQTRSETEATPVQSAPQTIQETSHGRQEEVLNAAGATAPAITSQDIEAHAAATSPFNATPQPTDAQKEAGNYRKGHIRFQGLDISIENPAGSERSGRDADGREWRTEMRHHYGYIKGTVGRDKDHIDVFIKPNAKTAGTAYVIDQIDPKTGRFDEHKIVFGADSEQDARAVYLSNYEEGWQGLGDITALPMADFKAWLKSGKTKKPLAYAEPKEIRAAQRRRPASDTLIQAVINRGGISRSIMQDVGADPKGRYQPGLFTSAGTTDLSEFAQLLFDEDGFHQIAQNSDIGPARELEELLSRAIRGERILNTDAMEREMKAGENAALRERAKAMGIKTAFRTTDEIAADLAEAERASILDEETKLEDEALVAYNDVVDALRAAIGDDNAETMLEELATRHQDDTHLKYLREATAAIQEKLNEAVSATGKSQETSAKPAGQGDEAGGAQSGSGAVREGARPEFDLEGQTEAGLAEQEDRRQAAEAQRLADEQAAERKAQADAERDTFALTGSDRPADTLAAQGQRGLFDSSPAKNEDSIAGKPVSEMTEDQLRTIARGLSPTYGEAAVDKAKAELRQRTAIPIEQKTPADAGVSVSEYTPPKSVEEARRRWSSAEFNGSPPERGRGHIALMDAVGRALDDGLFINRDVEAFVAKELGVTDEQRKAGTSEDPAATGTMDRVDGGAFGYDVYLAREIVQKERERAKNIELRKMLKLTIGENIGKLTVRADESGSLEEPAQSGGEAGSKGNIADQQAEGNTQKSDPYTIAEHADMIERMNSGRLSVDEYKQAFERLRASKDALTAEMQKLTKAEIMKVGRLPSYWKNDTKEKLVRYAVDGLADAFDLRETISYVLGQRDATLLAQVDGATQKTLDDYAARRNAKIAEYVEQRKALAEGIENPQTIEDFQNYIRLKKSEGMTYAEARMTLTPEQRATYDELVATRSRDARQASADQQKTDVQVAAKTTEGQIVATKHTRTGEDLFVVKSAERVERDVYNQWNATAKRMGGWYSSFRGNGAVPGFQFKTMENAEAFLKYLGGDVDSAKAAVQERRNAYADDKSQTAVERLREMADKLDEAADESLGRERKANTARRARFAAAAEVSANADKAMAQTMRNIAQGIESGTAKFLDRVRQKVQVEMLNGIVSTAQYAKLRALYPAYIEQERHHGEAPNAETADYAEFPQYTAYRSDLAKLARQMLAVDGTKKLGQQILAVADDVSDTYLKFAKENLHRVSTFSRGDGQMAAFANREQAEKAIQRSGLRDKAIVLPVKRGQNVIVQSPTFARENGIWEGDDDKRITMNAEAGAAIVAKNKEFTKRLDMPYTFEYVAEKQARLKAIGIETPAEFRAALREFIGLKRAPKAPDRVKELERAMVGRKNDGFDFFPTPADTVRAMLDAAELKEGMSVLEPSAGMGHIADLIRDAGIEPDVVELANDRKELLEAKGYSVVSRDFMDMSPRGFTYGDVFRHKDGRRGVMRGSGSMGSGRVGFHPLDANGNPDSRNFTWEDRDDLEGVEKRGSLSGYDRIIMNPPFGNRRDALHVRHAYDLLAPGGRLVALMGEGVFFGQDKKAQAFRDWLESVGGTSEKLEDGTFLDPSLPVNTGVNARMVVIDRTSSGMESRAAKEDLQFAADVLAQLDDDEYFRWPVSKSADLKTVFSEVYPGAKYFGEHTRADERDETGADHRHVFVNHLGKRFHVYTRDDGRVWLDVSQLANYDGGNQIYSAVSNWAYNAGMKFQGDPVGVSADAVIRRTVNMLSSALRFGTTRHLDAAREQIKGDPENGVEPLRWGSDDVENVRELIHTFTKTLFNKFPGLNDYHYDFSRRGFFDKQGEPVTQERFAAAARTGFGRAARAGEATIRRGVFLKSLVSSESSERPGILAAVLNGARSLGGLKNFLSKTTPAKAGVSVSGDTKSIQDVVSRFKSEFKGAAALDIRVVGAASEIPARYRPSPYAEGVFHDDAGLIYLVAGNLRTDDGKVNTRRAFQVLMHEAVGHYGLAAMMGERFSRITARVKEDARAKGEVKDDIYQPGHPDYATVEAVRLRYPDATENEVAQEVLARMAETDPGRTLFGYVRAMIRQWLRDTARALGIDLNITTAELNDLVALASAYMRRGDNLAEEQAPSGLVAASQKVGAGKTAGGMESRRTVSGNSGRAYTAAQQAAFVNVGREVETPSFRERVAGLWSNIGKKMAQGIADQFAPLKDLDKDAYLLARMSKGADGALEAMLMYGKVFIRDGVYDVDAKDGGVIDKLLRPLGKEADDFLWWVAGNRAADLAKQGRENLMSSADIQALKDLAGGQMYFDYTLPNGKTTRDRATAYAAAQKIFAEFNKSVLDIAEQSGLIDGQARAVWESDFYVPFYRDMEGDKPAFPNVKSGLVRQKAFERLKGGDEKLHSDLLANTILNWSHLLHAAAKNRAAKASLEAAERAGAATWIPVSEKGSVSYRDGGDEFHYRVDDPFILDAVTALEFSGFGGPAMKAMGAFKRWLTIGVTASPTFKIRNLIRDSISAIGTAELSYNPIKNLKEGARATSRDSQTYASMLASGGHIRFGTMIEGNRSDHVRRLVENGVDPDTILDDPSKLKRVWSRHVMPLIDAWNEIGDRSENINRAAIYEQLRAKGMGHAEASLAARDLLDFSMGGTWAAVRFLTAVVPFANARIQGLYKLGRAAKDDPKRLGYVVGAVALASLALLGAYHDDDDWKKREDWDRDTYWWFKIGGIAFRIPKPFEIGAIGTLAERSAELLFDKEMDGHRFGERLGKMVTDTFAMNPVPQMFKPLVDLYANRDSFTGRAIESMGMEKMRPEDRYTMRSSEFSKLVGKANVLSPVQVDHLIRGYFGWLGAAAVTSVDSIARLGEATPRPARELRDMFLIGSFAETLPSGSSRYVTQMYEQSKEIEEAYNSWQKYRKIGDTKKADEIYKASRDDIQKYRRAQQAKQMMTQINAQSRRIEADRSLSSEEKRNRLRQIAAQKDRVARMVAQ